MKLLANPLRRKRKANRTAAASGNPAEMLAASFPDSTDQQRSVIEAVTQYTMTSPERILALCEAVDYICKSEIDGDIVECGVWKGGSMAAVARTLQSISANERTLWMYDTYEGMSEPTANDVDLHGQLAQSLLVQEGEDNAEAADSIWCRCSLENVKNTLRDTGYPESHMRYVKGKVEDTLPIESPDKIAILRLDTDWYESTKCELENLFPKLVPGGVLIIDDFGHWQGCRKAVDEYFEKYNVKMFLHRVDYTGRLGIKLA